MTTNQPTDSTPTILPPRLVRISESSDDLECSLHYLPKPLLREFGHVFNDEYLKFSDASDNNGGDMRMMDSSHSDSSNGDLRLLAIPTNQRAREDLVAIGDHIEEEKDRLLNVVSDLRVCSILHSVFMWKCYPFLHYLCSWNIRTIILLNLFIVTNQSAVSKFWKICMRAT